MYRNSNGYACVCLPHDSSFFSVTSSRGYIAARRLVMAQHLGRCLHNWEYVRMKNHDRADIRVENLQLEAF